MPKSEAQREEIERRIVALREYLEELYVEWHEVAPQMRQSLVLLEQELLKP